MNLVASFDPDQTERAPSRRQAALTEAAFQMYWRLVRCDEDRARERFGKLKPEALQNWLDDAEAAFRVFERARL